MLNGFFEFLRIGETEGWDIKANNTVEKRFTTYENYEGYNFISYCFNYFVITFSAKNMTTWIIKTTISKEAYFVIDNILSIFFRLSKSPSGIIRIIPKYWIENSSKCI